MLKQLTLQSPHKAGFENNWLYPGSIHTHYTSNKDAFQMHFNAAH